MLIAILFSHSFPDEDFGYASRVLSGSWAAYALYQLLYPLRFFPELSNVLHLIFILALATKVAGVVALLNVLHVYYESAQEQATHASVLADLGNVAAGLHHDIATPLAVIDSELDQLARDQGEERRISQFLQRVNPSMQALYGALKVVDLARLNKSAEDQVTPTSARDAVNRAINLFRSQFPQAPLKIYVPGEVTYYVRAQVAILSQAFLNIIKNAHEAGAASLAIQIEKTGTTPGRVRFLFQNNGKLMSAEELRLCMKPGWSTKRQELGRANVGMGLYMTSKYVAIHRGEIKIKNREEKPGVEVIVEIPGSRSKSKGIEDT
jgi:signal transduction histidine kinase